MLKIMKLLRNKLIIVKFLGRKYNNQSCSDNSSILDVYDNDDRKILEFTVFNTLLSLKGWTNLNQQMIQIVKSRF